MSAETLPLETLDRKIAELASFVSPAEIFRALLEGTTAGAPRAAVFLMRDGKWKGWSSIGYPADAAQRQRLASLPADSGWFSALASEDDMRWRTLLPQEAAPDFRQGSYDETTGLPVRVSGKAVAVVVAQRRSGEEPWAPAAQPGRGGRARLRLELDLAWRRLKTLTTAASAGPPGAPVRAEEPAAVPAASPAAPAPAVAAPAPAAATSEMAPWSAEPGESDPRAEEARRYARLVATDIRLYNEEAVVVGRKQRDLAKRLDEHLKRGREAFARRFPDIGPSGTALLEDAYVQVLAGGDPSLLR